MHKKAIVYLKPKRFNKHKRDKTNALKGSEK
jgi:hypothetical protein